MLRILLPAVAGYMAYHCIHTAQGRAMAAKTAKTILKEAGVAEKTISKVAKAAKTASESFNTEEEDNEKKDGDL